MLCPLLLPICPFAKATEGQIVSWGNWAGSNTGDELSVIVLYLVLIVQFYMTCLFVTVIPFVFIYKIAILWQQNYRNKIVMYNIIFMVFKAYYDTD